MPIFAMCNNGIFAYGSSFDTVCAIIMMRCLLEMGKVRKAKEHET